MKAIDAHKYMLICSANLNLKHRNFFFEHCAWFEKKFEADDTKIFILEKLKKRIGQIRFDKNSIGQWIIDVNILAKYRNKGMGIYLLKQGIAKLKKLFDVNLIFVAEVLKINESSIKLFKQTEFEIINKYKKQGKLTYRLMKKSKFFEPETNINLFLSHRKWGFKVYKNIINEFPEKFLLIKKPSQLTSELLDRLKPKYVFLPDWSWKIPEQLLKKSFFIGFHSAPLPKFRGGSPIQNLS